jgi:lambda family phage portal protein
VNGDIPFAGWLPKGKRPRRARKNAPPTREPEWLQHSSRMYASAVPSRFNQGFPSFNTSEDLELVSSLRNMRARSRALVRDAGFAKSAKRAIVDNVIGTGVRVQPAVKTVRGGYNATINDGIADVWAQWMHGVNCHTGGAMHFHDMERMLMGQVFEAGEIFIRLHRGARFGYSPVPLALEVIEPERLVDGYAYPGAVAPKSGGVRLGIETDKFKKPIAYWIRDLHPGDIRLNLEQSDAVTRVDAADIIHLYIVDRWPQTRGVPWMHAAAGKVQDVNGYTEAEIIAARGAASYIGIIETPEPSASLAQQAPDNTYQMNVEPGVWYRAKPGEKLQFVSPNRPTNSFDPFMRYMLREISAAVGASYEAISHDYSQSNYSSTRLSLLNERDVWKALQSWWIRSFRHRLHREWMKMAVMARAIPQIDIMQYGSDPEKYLEANFKPRGWSWVDPTKEVQAYVQSVKSGFRTVTDVLEETGNGMDLEEMLRSRSAELEYMNELKLPFDTDPRVYVPAESRGQMVLNEKGDVVPAAEIAAQAQAAAAAANPPPGAADPVAAAKTAAAAVVEEPAAAEGDTEEDRTDNLLNFFRRRGRRGE